MWASGRGRPRRPRRRWRSVPLLSLSPSLSLPLSPSLSLSLARFPRSQHPDWWVADARVPPAGLAGGKPVVSARGARPAQLELTAQGGLTADLGSERGPAACRVADARGGRPVGQYLGGCPVGSRCEVYHQQPDVNYIQVIEKFDFPCTVNAQHSPFKGNQLRAETG